MISVKCFPSILLHLFSKFSWITHSYCSWLMHQSISNNHSPNGQCRSEFFPGKPDQADQGGRSSDSWRKGKPFDHCWWSCRGWLECCSQHRETAHQQRGPWRVKPISQPSWNRGSSLKSRFEQVKTPHCQGGGCSWKVIKTQL